MEGAKVALPVWMRILEKMKEKGRIDPKADFEAPPNVVFTAVDYETGLKATPRLPAPDPRDVRLRLAADRGVERALGGDHAPALVAPEVVLRAEEGRAERTRRPAPAPTRTPTERT